MVYVRHCRDGLSDIAGCAVTTDCPSGLTVGIRCRKLSKLINTYVLIDCMLFCILFKIISIINGRHHCSFGLCSALMIFEQAVISISAKFCHFLQQARGTDDLVFF